MSAYRRSTFGDAGPKVPAKQPLWEAQMGRIQKKMRIGENETLDNGRALVSVRFLIFNIKAYHVLGEKNMKVLK